MSAIDMGGNGEAAGVIPVDPHPYWRFDGEGNAGAIAAASKSGHQTSSGGYQTNDAPTITGSHIPGVVNGIVYIIDYTGEFTSTYLNNHGGQSGLDADSASTSGGGGIPDDAHPDKVIWEESEFTFSGNNDYSWNEDKFIEALEYLSQSQHGAEGLSYLHDQYVATGVPINIDLTTGDNFAGNGTAWDWQIHWNPANGIILPNGDILSPALALWHEFGHILQGSNAWTTAAYGGASGLLALETDDINNYEAPVATDLGEPVRTAYNGQPINAGQSYYNPSVHSVPGTGAMSSGPILVWAYLRE